MKKLMLSLAAATLLVPAVPAFAAPTYAAPRDGYSQNYDGAVHFDRDNRRDRRYDRNGRYANPRRVSRDERIWRGEDGRYRCRRENGTTGLIIGGAAGALAGRAIDTRGERTTGTIIGAVAGALAGREIDRGSARCQ